MLAKEIIELLKAKPLSVYDERWLEQEYYYGFASDLMSDALVMIDAKTEATVLITGLANVQSIRTAEMLDLSLIILVRGKQMDEESLMVAKAKNITILSTDYKMFEACGILYQGGMKPCA